MSEQKWRSGDVMSESVKLGFSLLLLKMIIVPLYVASYAVV